MRASHIVLTSRVIISTAANLVKQSPIHVVMFKFKLCLSGSAQRCNRECGLGVRGPGFESQLQHSYLYNVEGTY